VSAGLTLRFTKLSDERHRLEYRRLDGSGEAIEMETRSLLQHDLLHLALESEAGLRGSFYGILAKIGGYEELSVAGGAALGGEVAITERIVGALQGAMKDGEAFDGEAFAERMAEYLDLFGERPPRWLTPELLARVQERTRQLTGRWKATPYGGVMELAFPLAQ
jgi:hypothetical protein